MHNAILSNSSWNMNATHSSSLSLKVMERSPSSLRSNARQNSSFSGAVEHNTKSGHDSCIVDNRQHCGIMMCDAASWVGLDCDATSLIGFASDRNCRGLSHPGIACRLPAHSTRLKKRGFTKPSSFPGQQTTSLDEIKSFSPASRAIRMLRNIYTSDVVRIPCKRESKRGSTPKVVHSHR